MAASSYATVFAYFDLAHLIFITQADCFLTQDICVFFFSLMVKYVLLLFNVLSFAEGMTLRTHVLWRTHMAMRHLKVRLPFGRITRWCTGHY